MKKIVSILLVIFLLVGVLAACGRGAEADEVDTPQPTETPVLEEPPRPELELKISLASNELLGTFDHLHEVDYTVLREAIYGSGVERLNGDKLVIWANVPLYDLSLIAITSDFVDDNLVFIPVNAIGNTEALLPGQALVIDHYVEGGTRPTSGISFASESGERHYFWMLADQSVSMYPNPFSEPDFLGLFEDGSLEIEVRRDGRASQYFTVTLDEIGDADPIDWFVENRHLWYLFILSEFAWASQY
ncbi:MAG: hypothetical protein FWC93_02990 [Defluviitaleaceae bacterium]|nr:hypothetical protein [Defluviitaleaceae bacterium]